MALEMFSTRAAALALCLASGAAAAAAGPRTVEERLRALEAQNRRLQEQVQEQQEVISGLLERADEAPPPSDPAPPVFGGIQAGRLHISGEGGVAYFHTGSEGAHPHGSFRVDEAKLFLEAPLWTGTYFFSELDLTTRETNEEFFRLGELYVDFENVLRRWTDSRALNLRFGRIDIPFGEEYQVRDVIDNPLISHSLSDLWGVDEGIEIYGSLGQFSYVAAVQNGGHPILRDADGDKSFAGRIGWDPSRWLHFSASAMRTGNLHPEDDGLSEMWFGNGFFRSLGAEDTTTRFDANLFELDAQAFWSSGHLKLAGGYIEYDDDDQAADQRRDAWYYYADGKQDIWGKLYGAARFSHIIANDGLPLVGHGRFGRFFYGPLSTELWRLSLGLGYTWNERLVTKIEYTFEEGELLGGAPRENQNFLGAQVGFQF